MPYSAIPDRAIPYHIDGSVIKIINATTGVVKSFSSAEMLEMNDYDYTNTTFTSGYEHYLVVFFPELRDIHAFFGVLSVPDYAPAYHSPVAMDHLEWSADTTNGLDGTWTAATVSGGYPVVTCLLDDWRKGIKLVTGIAGAKAIRCKTGDASHRMDGVYILHLYGHKTAGQTPDDIIFLDAENSDAEFAADLDFGDRPAGTSLIRQIKVRNTSATLTANTLVVTVVDPVDNIRVSDSASGPWTTSQSFATLAPATSSAIIYVKCETAAPPTPLGPMRAPIKAVVGAWT